MACLAGTTRFDHRERVKGAHAGQGGHGDQGDQDIGGDRQHTSALRQRTIPAAQADRDHDRDRHREDLEQSAAGERIWDRPDIVRRAESYGDDQHEEIRA